MGLPRAIDVPPGKTVKRCSFTADRRFVGPLKRAWHGRLMPTPNEPHLEQTNPLAEADFAADLDRELTLSLEKIEGGEYIELSAELPEWGDLELDLSPDQFPA
jgi:hypothetical protein